MRLVIKKSLRGVRALQAEGDACLGARGYALVRIEPNGLSVLDQVPASFSERLLARWRVTRQAFRVGVHNWFVLPNGDWVIVCKRRILKRCASGGEFREVERIKRGNKPAFHGLAVCPDGTVLYGEYAMNLDRSLPIAVYRSEDSAESFHKVHEFRPGEVRHIHLVQWDPYAGCLWMGTGDADRECRLYRSDNQGSTWDLVGQGTQTWRTIGLAFTEDYVYWGTDAGSDAGTTPNWIVRQDRSSGEIEKMVQVQGPCHGIGKLADGTLMVSTGVEGGKNEKDDCAHLWVSRDGTNWSDVASWRKDRWPFLVQFGVLHFPHGPMGLTILTGFGLRASGETTILSRFEV